MMKEPLLHIWHWYRFLIHYKPLHLKDALAALLSIIFDILSFLYFRSLPLNYFGGIFILKNEKLVFVVRPRTDDLYSVTPGREGLIEKFILGSLEEVDVFIDVGANIGYYSLLAAKRVGLYGKVIAFEPVPSTSKILKINYVLNKRLHLISSPIIIIEKAAWESSNDKVKIIIPLTGSQIYFGLSGISTEVKFSSIELNVNTCTLDEELRILGLENKNIKVLKVDVEGNEKAVLLGAQNCLKRTLKIYVECSKDAAPYIIEFLKKFNFKFTYIDAKEVIHLLGTKDFKT